MAERFAAFVYERAGVFGQRQGQEEPVRVAASGAPGERARRQGFESNESHRDGPVISCVITPEGFRSRRFLGCDA
jgi:hypothetical protein